LTELLLEKKPSSLNLIELDRDMVSILEKRIQNNELKID
jgi:16S rRNA A1518/A1519 N6-dimethyltransferase RsmA/KsgA/DIM1 with predicted DNA glycosylase/AP lyase activity